MAVEKVTIRQRDWSAGQLDPVAFRRDDLKFFAQAAKRAENLRPLPLGGLTRRPGRSVIYFDGGRHDLVRPTSDTSFDVTFAAGRFTARLRSGAVVSDLTAPWTADMLAALSWVPFENCIYVCHKTMRPQVLTYDRDAGTWSIAPYTFRTSLDSTLSVPFYRFAAFGQTMQPSGLSGTVTLTTSADVFVSGHVGTVFEYAGKQVVITAVTDARHATALCLEPLPPVWRVTVSDVTGFKVGEIVVEDTSNAEGEVIAINTGSNYLDILTTQNGGSGAWGNGDNVVGSAASSAISASTTTGPSPAATVQWQEQFMSDVRGWPGSVSQGFLRLCFCDFDQLENGILWTAIQAPDDLLLGGQADQAILETVPMTCRVQHVAGTADLFVLTDRSVHYIPISADNPLAPGTVEFRPLGTAGAASVKPVEVGDSLVFIGATLPLVWAITPTGTQTHVYEVKKLNELAQSLFAAPVAIAASEGQTDTNPEQHIFVVNGDGSMVIGHGTLDGDIIGWFPWASAARISDVVASQGDVIFTCRYTLRDGVTTVDTVEAIDATQILDGAIGLVDFAATDPLRDSTGDSLLDSTGDMLDAASGALLPFAGETMQAWADDGYYLGDVAVDGSGRIEISGRDLLSVTLGWKFTPVFEPLLETFQGGASSFVTSQGQATRRRKVARAAVTMQETQAFVADRRVFASYRVGEDMGQPPPARDGTYTWRQVGRAYDPSVQVSQPTPGKFTMVEFAAEVTV